jgi:hypothetical protein
MQPQRSLVRNYRLRNTTFIPAPQRNSDQLFILYLRIAAQSENPVARGNPMAALPMVVLERVIISGL